MGILTITKLYSSTTVLTEAQLDGIKNSLENFINGQNLNEDNIEPNSLTTDSLSTSVVNSLAPTGSVVPYAGTTAPTGWLICDGSEFDATTYSALDLVLNGAFEDGAEAPGNSRLPDLQGRAVVGRESAATRITQALQDPAGGASDSTVIGAAGGEETHVLTEAEMDNHTHGFTSTTQVADNNHTHGAGSLRALIAPNGANIHGQYKSIPSWSSTYASALGGGTVSDTTSFTAAAEVSGNSDTPSADTTISGITDSTGSDSAHNNLQPLQVFNYIIKT
jgi:microcystin-dependent protein